MKRFILILYATIYALILIAPLTLTAQVQLHHANQDLPCINKNYNILAHVAVDSTGRTPLYTEQALNKMLTELNDFFRPICVSFSICEYHVLEDDYSLGRVIDQPLTVDDQLQELKNRFSLRRRINVYFLDFIDNNYCGESTFEGILTLLDANIFIEQTCPDDLSGQLAHHLGHTFGLRNTFDPATIELVDGSNCTTTGDLLCDTPADPLGQTFISPADQLLLNQEMLDTTFVRGCEFVYEIKDPNGEYYQPDMGNIMSNYPCKCGFTQDQYRLMVETILSSDIKHF